MGLTVNQGRKRLLVQGQDNLPQTQVFVDEEMDDQDLVDVIAVQPVHARRELGLSIIRSFNGATLGKDIEWKCLKSLEEEIRMRLNLLKHGRKKSVSQKKRAEKREKFLSKRKGWKGKEPDPAAAKSDPETGKGVKPDIDWDTVCGRNKPDPEAAVADPVRGRMDDDEDIDWDDLLPSLDLPAHIHCFPNGSLKPDLDVTQLRHIAEEKEVVSLDIECVFVGGKKEGNKWVGGTPKAAIVSLHAERKESCINNGVIFRKRGTFYTFTPVTGIGEGDLEIEKAISEEEARERLKKRMEGKLVLTCGDSVKEFKYMGLIPDDTVTTFNIQKAFMSYNGIQGWQPVSLKRLVAYFYENDAEAKGFQTGKHNPTLDAKFAYRLFMDMIVKSDRYKEAWYGKIPKV